ncbi:MAG TPA: HAD family hydrolase [Micavibrio sp.]
MTKMTLNERFSTLKGALWDLDNTLYAETSALHEAFDHAIAAAVLAQGVPMSLPEAKAAAKKSFIEHGYGARVFIDHMGVDAQKLHYNLHPLVDEKIITPHDTLPDDLQALSLSHAIVTHGARDWALRVLHHLKLMPLFTQERIHALEDFDFHKKAVSALPFERALASLNLNPQDVIIVEDQERNLRIPHRMGMGTILLDYGARAGKPAADFVDLVCHDVHDLIRRYSQMKS